MRKLVKAYMHKDRAVLTAFLLIIILSAFVMQIGLFLNDYEKRYDRIASEEILGSGSIRFIGNEEEVRDIVSEIPEVESFSSVKTIVQNELKYKRNDSTKEKTIGYPLLFKMDTYAKINDVTFTEKDESIRENYIYLNVYAAYNNGLKVGDTMHITSENYGDYDLTVAGIYEDLLAGNPYSYLSVILDDKTYQNFTDRAEELELEGIEFGNCYFMTYVLKDGIDESDGLKIIEDTLAEHNIFAGGYVADLAKKGYISVVNIIAAFMTSFSIIIMIICFIMIMFTVNNNISRDIRNIGALKAVGYTVTQIRASLCLEYLIMGLAGTVTGIILAYAAYPAIDENVVRKVSGMIWEQRFYPEHSLVLLAAFLLVIEAVVFLSARKLKKIHAATALRFGLAANSFKKNVLPLSETRGGLNMLLAMKSTFQSMGQNVIIFGIVVAVSFLTIFSGVLFYNTKIDMNNFQRILQGDSPDAYVNLDENLSEDEIYDVIEQISNMDGVTEAYGLGSSEVQAYVNDNASNLLFSDKPQFVYCGVYDGEMVREDNEAVLGSITAEKAGVGIGDEVEVRVGDKTERFLVTGLQQAVYGLGERIYITAGGAKRLGIENTFTYVRVRVKDADIEKVDEFNERVKNELGLKVTSTENHFKDTRSSDNVPVYAVGIVVMIIAVLNIIIIMVVIRLLLKTIFIKREKEFGIKKAVGFTSSQLRLQLALSLMPTSLIAALTGAVMGHVLINPLFALVFRSFGIMESDLIMKPVLIILSLVVVSALMFFFSFVMSGRMKRVSAYNLIQE